jgi:Outer membrane lipoprotein-sorting protein
VGIRSLAGNQRRSRLSAGSVLCLFVSVLALALSSPSSSAADAPDAKTIVRKMRAATNPDRPTIRRIKVRVSMSKGEGSEWQVVEARKKLDDGIHRLIVVLEPEEAKGTAYLIVEQEKGTDQLWMYLPHLNRVRKLSDLNRYEAFLNSDFALADFGLGVANPTYRLLGSAKLDGVDCFQVEETSDETWHYARVVDWVAQDSFQRLRRDFYDVADRLWKVEHFENITTVEGVPTPLRIRMEDQQRGASTVIEVEGVKFDAPIPNTSFDPQQLRAAADNPAWSSVEPSNKP